VVKLEEMDSLVLNCFPGEISPLKLKFPYIDSIDWEQSTTRMRELGEHSSYRFPVNDGVRAILISGPECPRFDGTEEFDVGQAQLGGRIVETALALHLQRRGMEIAHTSFQRLQ
jgi:hypothetical protein